MTGNHFVDALMAPVVDRATPFLIQDDGGIVTYRDFVARTGQLANALRGNGLRPGDRVLARFPKSVTHLALHFACIRAGLVLIPASPTLGEPDFLALVRQYRVKLAIGDEAIIALDGLSRHQSPEFQDVARSADDIAVVMLTSGTTGKPKACMLTHGNLVSSARTVSGVWGMADDDIVFHALPIYHTHGLLISTNAALAARCAMRFTAAATGLEMVEAIRQSTIVMGTPKIYSDLLACEAFDRQATTNVRLFISGGSPLGRETLKEFEHRTGQKMLERHGMTEASVSTSNPRAGERRPGSVGPVLPDVQLRVVHPETGQALSPGAIGSIEIKGPNVFAGYLDDPEATGRAFRDDGWFITGDIGRLQADGYVEVLARASDLIRCGDDLVDPREIEDAIDSLAGVKEAAVIGLTQRLAGERILGVVVRQPGKAISEAAILDHLSGRLAPEKLPHGIRFVDRLPRTGTGKVSKQTLRDMLARDPAIHSRTQV